MTSPDNSLTVVRGACGHDCPDTCSWVVEVRDGTAERLSGDPAHPFTRGTLCAKVNHYLERVYHPDRVLHPLKRAGRKGEGQFVRVSWDEALPTSRPGGSAIAAESGAEAILPYSSAGVQGLIQRPRSTGACSDRWAAAASIARSAAPSRPRGCRPRLAPARASIRNRWSTAGSSCCGGRTPSSRTSTSGRWCAKRSVAAPRSSSSIRSARARRRRPTGTCRSSPAAMRRWRWR